MDVENNTDGMDVQQSESRPENEQLVEEEMIEEGVGVEGAGEGGAAMEGAGEGGAAMEGAGEGGAAMEGAGEGGAAMEGAGEGGAAMQGADEEESGEEESGEEEMSENLFEEERYKALYEMLCEYDERVKWETFRIQLLTKYEQDRFAYNVERMRRVGLITPSGEPPRQLNVPQLLEMKRILQERLEQQDREIAEKRQQLLILRQRELARQRLLSELEEKQNEERRLRETLEELKIEAARLDRLNN